MLGHTLHHFKASKHIIEVGRACKYLRNGIVSCDIHCSETLTEGFNACIDFLLLVGDLLVKLVKTVIYNIYLLIDVCHFLFLNRHFFIVKLQIFVLLVNIVGVFL